MHGRNVLHPSNPTRIERLSPESSRVVGAKAWMPRHPWSWWHVKRVDTGTSGCTQVRVPQETKIFLVFSFFFVSFILACPWYVEITVVFQYVWIMSNVMNSFWVIVFCMNWFHWGVCWDLWVQPCQCTVIRRSGDHVATTRQYRRKEQIAYFFHVSRSLLSLVTYFIPCNWL